MRLAVITDDYPPLDGGIATWTAAVVAGLVAADVDVQVLARARDGLDPSVIGVRGRSFGRFGPLWTAIAERRLDVDRRLATTWPLALGCRCPVDVVFHGSDLTRRPPSRSSLAGPGFLRACRRAERRFVVSRFLRDLLGERGFSADVLPAPIDALPPTPRAPTGRWAMIGRATALKGGDRFVRLCAKAGVPGVVYGDGPALSTWKAVATPNVSFRGRVSRDVLLSELTTYDLVFLLPRADVDGSGAEGFGLSLVEAAARGVATVGCRTGGVPEAVGAGLLLDDPDDVDGSLAAIVAWYTPERGEACRAHVQAEHGVARVVSRILALESA